MITKQLINNFQKELEDSYLFPARGIKACGPIEEGFNERLIAAIECCIQLKIYLKDRLIADNLGIKE